MNQITILDHGYISLIETWGSDERIIEAARMSTAKGFQGWGDSCPSCKGSRVETMRIWDEAPQQVFYATGKMRLVGGKYHEIQVVCSLCGGSSNPPGDEKLLRYLWEHKHATPFEMAGAIFEIQAPIFVFREWHRHRTQSYNEMSARYTPLPNVNYIPTIDRLLVNSKSNRQAGVISGAEELNEAKAGSYLAELKMEYDSQEQLYQIALSIGIPKELARIHLPVGRYSRMRASANLRNWLAFLTLRMDQAAQWEIRQYANAACNLLASIFPRTVALFLEGMK